MNSASPPQSIGAIRTTLQMAEWNEGVPFTIDILPGRERAMPSPRGGRGGIKLSSFDRLADGLIRSWHKRWEGQLRLRKFQALL